MRYRVDVDEEKDVCINEYGTKCYSEDLSR